MKTRFKRTSKEMVELERYSDGLDIRVVADFLGKTVDTGKSHSGFVFIDRILGGIDHPHMRIEIPKQTVSDELAIKEAGFAAGETLRKLHEKRKAKETGVFISSDGEVACMFAIGAKKQPGEANIQITGKPDFEPEQFFAFFDGLAQGMECELNVFLNTERGEKHAEFVSHAFSESLKRIFV